LPIDVRGLPASALPQTPRCPRADHPRTSALRVLIAPTRSGAHERNRTADLLLTMQMLYRLSYVGAINQDLRRAALLEWKSQ